MAGSSASASGVVGPAGAGDVLGPPALSNGVATGEPPPSGEVDSGGGPDGCPPGCVSPWMTCPHPHWSWVERLQEMEAQKRADIGTLIVVERRDAPHIRHGEVQSPIAINIGDSNTSTHLGLVEPELWSNVIVPAILGSHIERVVFVTTDVGTWLQDRIVPRIVDERFITRTQLL